MRRGKEIAQSSHASLACIIKGHKVELTQDQIEWFSGNFAKITVQVNSEQELLDIYNLAKKEGLNAELILDQGLTEFKEPTYTVCCIGPHKSEILDKITGHLKLY